MSALFLGMPDIMKPFYLFVDEQHRVAKDVLTSIVGLWRRAVEYLSKILDPVAVEWPATVLLLKGIDKGTVGSEVGHNNSLAEALL